MTDGRDQEAFSVVEHNGVEFPLVTERRCIVCNHPDRLIIENAYFQGLRGRAVLAQIESDNVSERNVSEHMNRGHAPTTRDAALALMIQRAREEGLSLEDYEKNKSKELITAELVLDKFRSRLADDDFQPDYKDGLAAIKLLREMTEGSRSEGFDSNDLFVVFSTFLNYTRTVLSRYAPNEVSEAMQALGRLLDQDPVLRSLIAANTIAQESSMLDEREIVVEAEEALDEFEVTDVESEPEVATPQFEWDDEREPD